MTTDAGPRPAPFAGREEERRLLDEMLANPGSRCAVLTGEPGIGRTALLEQVASAAGRVLWVRGAANEAAPAYAGVADLLLPLWGCLDTLPPDALPPVQRDALAVALALRPGPVPSPLAVCAGALGMLAAVAEPGPLLVVVDDFQWLDPESRQVLAFVARRLVDGPVAMLVAVRDGPGSPAEPLGLPTMRLSGLPVPDCRALVAGLGHEMSATVVAEIVEQTGGNPLAVLHALVDGSGDELEHPLTRAWGDVVDNLPERARTALSVLAAAGRPTRPVVVEAVLATVGCSLADLADAERAGLVATAPLFGLRHPLVGPAVLDRTPLPVRLAVYRALARHADPHLRAGYLAAATTGPDDDVADCLATAADEARLRGDRSGSARLWHRCAATTVNPARRARRQLAAATDAHLAGEDGLAVAWCDEPAATGGNEGDTADLGMVRGRAEAALGRPRRAAADLVRIAEAVLTHDAARAERLHAEAALPFALGGRWDDVVATALRGEEREPAERRSLPALAVAAYALAAQGDSRAARQRLALAEPLVAPGVPAWDLPFVTALSAAHLLLEEVERARGLIGVVLDVARRTGATSAGTAALVLRGELEHRAGNWTAACVDATEALRCAEERRDGTALTAALVILARVDAARGDAARCRQRLDRARRYAAEQGIGCVGVEMPSLLGIAALGGGDNAAATGHLEAARLAAGCGPLLVPAVVPFCGDLVEALVRAGHRVRAAEALSWLDDLAGRTGLVHPAAAAARCRGLLSSDLHRAEACFAEAKALHDRVENRFERARTLLCEGETLRRLRRPAAARSPLQAAAEMFDELGARTWALRAERESAATGRRPAAGSTAGGLDRLTPQEREIARAVADGLSNAEAAATLFLSRKTVEAHLTRVYRKLGLRSRTELAREVARSER